MYVNETTPDPSETTRSNPAYCLQQKSYQQQPTYSLGYPQECQSKTAITFEQLVNGEFLRDETWRATLTTKRNDHLKTSHNHLKGGEGGQKFH